MKIVFDSEKELEDWIFDKYNEGNGCVIDDTCPQHLLRQVNLGSYGICDLVAIDVYATDESRKSIDVIVYEIKKEKITADAFSQVARYAAAIKQEIESEKGMFDITITCALVAPEIDDSAFILNNFDFKYYQPFFNPECGVEFKDCSFGYTRKNEKISAISNLLIPRDAVEKRGFQ